ncbi:MAG: PilZ domain-containing protein [Acidobacteria bacterium]|nr:PilZ domain-containing protein [Acidobacteriota bacterium]MBS1867279.1 PilZ domain-containing protein [Acidobacteriota bacterium]
MKPAHPQKAQTNPVRPGLTRPLTAEERRRAQRVLVRISVKVHVTGKTQILEGFTHTVSANGALIVVPEALAQGTKITVENVKTQKTIEATVVRPPQFSPDGPMLPVEFVAASPTFWNIFFPPVVN